MKHKIVNPSTTCTVPGSHWIICEVSALNLENCANASRIYVFWVINSLFLTLPGYGRIVNRSATCTVESLTYLCFNSTYISKTVWMRSELTFFERLTLPYPFWGTVEIVNHSLTSYVESLTYLWNFNSISWKLCKCTSNLRFLSEYLCILDTPRVG